MTPAWTVAHPAAVALGPGVFHVPGFLTPPQVAELLAFANGPTQEATVQSGGVRYADPTHRSHRLRHSGWKDQPAAAVTGPFAAFAAAAAALRDAPTVSMLETQVTEVGQFFNWHFDAGPGLQRTLTVLAWLSTGFEGGRTEFKTTAGEVGLVGQPGDAVAFDPAILHRGAPVTKGRKVTAVAILG